MPGRSQLADGIDRLVAAIGRAVAWLALFVVLVQFAVVVLRYAFGIGSIWLSESVIYGHATMFMLAAAWTLQAGGHVRVDIFYADAVAAHQGAGRSAGFAAPAAAVRGGDRSGSRVPYVARSWALLERSRETSGLPFVYLLKTVIPLFAAC